MATIIEAFESVDGKVFTDEQSAKRHDEDCIGSTIDALLIKAAADNITYIEKYRMVQHILNNREELKPILARLNVYLENE